MTFTFAQPYWLTLLLLLPLLAWLRGRHGSQPAFLYSSVQLVKRFTGFHRSSSGAFLRAMRWLTLALFIVGLARPRLGEGHAAVSASGIDIVVAFDLSGSMAAEDFKDPKGEPVNRLYIGRKVLHEFIDKRPNDRIGLVAFAERAYIASPLSLDHDFLRQNLDRLSLETIKGDGTAIGSAISASVNRLRDVKSRSKIVILMTDGQSNAGKIPPLTAADAAAALAIKVYTIGVGTKGVAKRPVIDPFGRKIYVEQNVDIDEESLQEIAKRTGARYFRADNTETLRKIYTEIDKMEKTEVEVKKYEQYRELYAWVVAPGLVLLLLEIILSQTIWRRLP
ncbi:MAG: VWA domain-containing protein [Verrucomicrobiota bacterium]